MATRKKADIGIIGGGLTGLTVAALCERLGLDYMLIESQAEFGGLVRGQMEKDVWLDYGLKSVPVGPVLDENPLLCLKKNLGLEFGIESWTDAPKTWSHGAFADFMGFGESKNRQMVE